MKVLSLDLETTTTDWQKAKILLNGYRVDAQGDVIYARTESVDPTLNSALRDPSNILRGHNIKYDALVLANNGYEVNCQLEDTRVLAYLQWPDEESHGLKHLVKTKLGRNPTELSGLLFTPLKRELGHFEDFRHYYFAIEDKYCRIDLLTEYHREDVLNIDRLRAIMVPSKWFYQVEMPLTRLLFESELHGCPLNVDYLKTLKEEYENRIGIITKNLFELAGKEFNPNATKQIASVYQEKGYDLATTFEKTKTGYSTDSLALRRLSWEGDSFARELLNYRRLSKLLSTYIKPFVRDSETDRRLHGSFNQAGSEDIYGDGSRGTNTGRLASADPNLQNIPARTQEGKGIRKAFQALEGEYAFDTDLEQIEPRYVAHLSQSRKLLSAYANGVDTHALFASDIFGKPIDQVSKIERFIGKTSWLATVYRCWYKKLLIIAERNSDEPIVIPNFDRYLRRWDSLRNEPPARASWADSKTGLIKQFGNEARARDIYAKWEFFRDVQDAFKRTNPEIMEWSEDQIKRARKVGYITTYGNRRIYLPDLESTDRGLRAKAERKAVNSPVQGSCADIMKIITIEYGKRVIRPHGAKLFAIVHDEIFGSLKDPKHLDLVQDVMENTCHLNNVLVKADTKLVSNWSEK